MHGKDPSKALLLLSFAILGLLTGIMFASTLESGGMRYVLGGGLIVIIILLVFTISIISRKERDKSEDIKEGSKVGFVVDTFHELMGKLKDKEKELQELRSAAEDRADSMEIYSQNILQSVPSGVITIDNSLIIKSINRAAEKVLGINATDRLEKNFTEVFREPLVSIIKGSRDIIRGEYQYITDDRRHIWLGVTTSQLRNADGEQIGFIFVFTDLTDIKALEARVELKQRLSQLGEMSAGISHEMRNSMSVISGYAKLLLKKVDESNRITAEAIIAEIKNMDEVISELLAFARPTVLNKRETDMGRLISETVENSFGDNNMIKVSVETESNMHVKLDEILLRQALSNIFINAADAMPEGGNFKIKLKQVNNKVEIYINDTGHGMTDDVIQKIFLPFYTTKEKGVGMGLALVQKIIVSHGGTIEVNSSEGAGTAFVITLPIQ